MNDQILSSEDFDIHDQRLYQNYLSQHKMALRAIRTTWILSTLLIAFLAGWISVNDGLKSLLSLSPILATILCMGFISLGATVYFLAIEKIEVIGEDLYENYKSQLFRRIQKKSHIYFDPLPFEEWKRRVFPSILLRELINRRTAEIYESNRSKQRRIGYCLYYLLLIVLEVIFPFVALCFGSFFLFTNTFEPLALGITLINSHFLCMGSEKACDRELQDDQGYTDRGLRVNFSDRKDLAQ